MGTKGRDACLWLYFMLALVFIFAGTSGRRIVLLLMLGNAACLLHYWRWYLPIAARNSGEMGLKIAVLLPLNGRWAGLLLRLDQERMDFHGAYEVHIKKGERHALGEYLKYCASDLEIAQRRFPGAVFMWETSAPLPLFVRRLVRQGSADGSAFLKNGGWPVPRFPFTRSGI